jgi:hypothetical protein
VELATIDGLTETQPDTEPLTARLVEAIASRPSRAQDDLEKGLASLERAYSNEPNKRLKQHIEEAIKLLRYGPKDGDSNDNEPLYHE